MAIQAPELTIRDLLKNNWNASNTSGVTPTTHTGWYDQDNNDPQVTVTDPVENATGGGNTGYFGIDGAGNTAHQQLIGSVDVNCWAHRDDGTGVNSKQLVHEFSEEVKRIVRANYLSATDLDFISFQSRQRFVDTGMSPTRYRMRCSVGYGYLETA